MNDPKTQKFGSQLLAHPVLSFLLWAQFTDFRRLIQIQLIEQWCRWWKIASFHIWLTCEVVSNLLPITWTRVVVTCTCLISISFTLCSTVSWCWVSAGPGSSLSSSTTHLTTGTPISIVSPSSIHWKNVMYNKHIRLSHLRSLSYEKIVYLLWWISMWLTENHLPKKHLIKSSPSKFLFCQKRVANDNDTVILPMSYDLR